MTENKIIVGKTYSYFDDGKIRNSREYPCIITAVIPFNQIDEDTLALWKEEVEECYWLYAKETDFFVKAALIFPKGIEKVVFVRTKKDTWFSLGWWGGLLDTEEKFKTIK